MPSSPAYDLYVSHAWKFGEFYDRLHDLLHESPDFQYTNHSTVQDKPSANANTDAGEQAIIAAIEAKLAASKGMIILSGMYVANNYWMKKELDLAIKHKKPIIGIIPWGQGRIPVDVQKNAIEMVGWSAPTITEAIRRHFV